MNKLIIGRQQLDCIIEEYNESIVEYCDCQSVAKRKNKRHRSTPSSVHFLRNRNHQKKED